MNLLSILLNTYFLLGLLALIYVFCKRKLASVVFITNFLLNTYMMNILKSSYQEPRPFWASKDVKLL